MARVHQRSRSFPAHPGSLIRPEQLELLLEEIGSNSLQAVAQEIGELVALPGREVPRILEQRPSTVLEQGFVAIAHFVDRLVQLRDDGVAIENMDGVTGALDLIPTALEDLCDLLPGEPLRPACEEPREGTRARALPLRPRDALDGDSTPSAVHPPHPVEEEDANAPERNELEAPLSRMIIDPSPLPASAAERAAALPRPDADLERVSIAVAPSCTHLAELGAPAGGSLRPCSIRRASFATYAADPPHP